MKKFYLLMVCGLLSFTLFGQSKVFEGDKPTLQLVKNKENAIIKTINNATLKTAEEKAIFLASAEENVISDTIFFEGFEAYDENVEDWLPDGWSTERYEAGDEEWRVANYIPGLFENIPPTDGEYLCWINFHIDLENYILLPQDEWLITPTIKVGSEELLTFDFNHAPIFLYYKMDENTAEYYIDLSSTTASLQVQVSKDNGETWDLIWDVHELVDRYDEETIFDYIDAVWENISLSLEEYKDQEIKIAFRYVGRDGDSMGLDNIVIGNNAVDPDRIIATNLSSKIEIKKVENAIQIANISNYSSLSVYSISGNLIGMFDIAAVDTYSISEESLSKGLYIFKFDGESSVSLKVLNR